MKHIMNQFGKIHYAIIFMLIVLFTIPTLLYHEYQLHGALVPAGKVIEVGGKIAELKYKREEKTVILKLNDSLFYDDWIMTGPNSTVRVLLDEGKKSKEKVGFFIYENSKFKIDKVIVDKAGNKKIVVQHNTGILRALAKGLKKGDEIQVLTPTVTVGIRGSDCYISNWDASAFATKVENKNMARTEVYNIEGNIGTYRMGEDTTFKPISEGIRVVFNEKGTAISTEKGTPPIQSAPNNIIIVGKNMVSSPATTTKEENAIDSPTGNASNDNLADATGSSGSSSSQETTYTEAANNVQQGAAGGSQ